MSLTEVIFSEYQCHFRYKGKSLSQSGTYVNGKIFFPDEKRSSKVYFGYSHKLEMGTHIAIFDTGAGSVVFTHKVTYQCELPQMVQYFR